MTRTASGSSVGTFGRFASRATAPDTTRTEPVWTSRVPAETPEPNAARGFFAGSLPAFSDRVRAELAPTGVLEELLASQLIAAAWRLNVAACDEAEGVAVPREAIAELQGGLSRSLADFARARSIRRARWGHTTPGETLDVVLPPETAADLEDEDLVPQDGAGWSRRFDPVPSDPSEVEHEPEEEADAEDESADPSLLWRDRLILDPDVSPRSPVVKGTWVTAAHVVTLVVDGWSWADILRAHPELCEADIRACLTYSIEEEGSGLPLD